MTRDHEKYAPLLDAFIDAELPEDLMAETGFHVAECPDCQLYMRDVAQIREAFPAVEDTVAPEGFAESVMAALPARKGVYKMENNNLDSRNESALENANGGYHTNTPGGANNQNNQNGQNSQNNQNNQNRQRNWRTIAMALAACLVVVAAVQVSGVLNPGRVGAAEGVGAAMSQSSASGAGVDDAVSGEEQAGADTADLPVESPETEENAENTEDTADLAALNEIAATEDDINTQDSAAPDENGNSDEDNNAPDESAAAKASADTGADTGTDTDAGAGDSVTARSAEAEQSEPEAELQSSMGTGEPESILNGAAAGAGDNAAEEETADNGPDYEAELTLPADAAPILSAFEPLETVSNGTWYALSRDHYAALLEQLDGAGFVGNDIRIPRQDIIYVFVES